MYTSESTLVRKISIKHNTSKNNNESSRPSLSCFHQETKTEEENFSDYMEQHPIPYYSTTEEMVDLYNQLPHDGTDTQAEEHFKNMAFGVIKAFREKLTDETVTEFDKKELEQLVNMSQSDVLKSIFNAVIDVFENLKPTSIQIPNINRLQDLGFLLSLFPSKFLTEKHTLTVFNILERLTSFLNDPRQQLVGTEDIVQIILSIMSKLIDSVVENPQLKKIDIENRPLDVAARNHPSADSQSSVWLAQIK